MEHKYLIYTIFFTIIVGIILSLIGNNMLKQISYDTNIVSCNPDVLEQLSSDNSPNSNAFILNFTGLPSYSPVMVSSFIGVVESDLPVSKKRIRLFI